MHDVNYAPQLEHKSVTEWGRVGIATIFTAVKMTYCKKKLKA